MIDDLIVKGAEEPCEQYPFLMPRQVHTNVFFVVQTECSRPDRSIV